MAYNYENKLIETIQYMVDHAVAAAPYDKTIKCTILSCDDESIAKYKVRYQDAIFFAYGSSPDVHFTSGSEVYVLVPGNDQSRDKTIIGSTEKLGTNYISVMGNDILYVPMGNNAVERESQIIDKFKLNSYKEEERVLYRTYFNEQGEKVIENYGELDINNDILKKNLADAQHIRIGASFTTNIEQKQQGGTGQFGLAITLKFIKKDGSLDAGELDSNCVSRNFYIVDINDLANNPYSLTDYLQTKDYEADGENFVEVEKISIFSRNFTYQDPESTIQDICIHNFQIIPIKKIDAASPGGSWMVITAPMGAYFDETHGDKSSKTLETTIYVGGKIVNPKSQKVNYYWFVEDVRVNPNWEDKDFYKKNYCAYGGNGWRCLNQYNIISAEGENQPETIDWISGESTLTIKKEDILSRQIRYKCVAVYNGTNLSYETLIHNYDSQYIVEVTSRAGELFYFDSGLTDLTCEVKKGEAIITNNLIYVWGLTDYLGNEFYIEGTTPQGGVITDNKIENLPIYEIKNFSTYSCSVFKLQEDNTYAFIGVGAVTLTNSMEQGGQYTLVIKNGSQIFKYNENGVAPNENLDGTPFEIQALSFILYNSLGNEVEHDYLNGNYTWFLPLDKTMLIFEGEYPEEDIIIDEDGNRWAKWKGHETLSYKIASQYNYNYTNNTIRLEVGYQGAVFIANTDFVFTKEGEDGTNGTDYYCRIVPKDWGTKKITSPLLVIRNNNSEDLKFYSNGEYLEGYTLNEFLKTEVWENGNRVPDGSFTFDWDIAKNSYEKDGNNNIIKDKSYIGYEEVLGIKTWVRLDNNTPQTTTGDKKYVLEEPSPALNIKSSIKYQDMNLYATYPLNWGIAYGNGHNYIFNISNGFRYVTYGADGTRPQYNTDPFEINVKNGTIDITNNLTFDWTAYGYLYVTKKNEDETESKYWEKQEPFRITYFRDDEGHIIDKYRIKVTPPDIYNGHCVNYIIQCKIKEGNNQIAILQIPVHLMLNRYGHAALNNWDGNSVSIDADGCGAILAPQIGAGRKDPETNTFTGLLMRNCKRSRTSKLLYWITWI